MILILKFSHYLPNDNTSKCKQTRVLYNSLYINNGQFIVTKYKYNQNIMFTFINEIIYNYWINKHIYCIYI